MLLICHRAASSSHFPALLITRRQSISMSTEKISTCVAHGNFWADVLFIDDLQILSLSDEREVIEIIKQQTHVLFVLALQHAALFRVIADFEFYSGWLFSLFLVEKTDVKRSFGVSVVVLCWPEASVIGLVSLIEFHTRVSILLFICWLLDVSYAVESDTSAR